MHGRRLDAVREVLPESSDDLLGNSPTWVQHSDALPALSQRNPQDRAVPHAVRVPPGTIVDPGRNVGYVEFDELPDYDVVESVLGRLPCDVRLVRAPELDELRSVEPHVRVAKQRAQAVGIRTVTAMQNR